MKTRPSTSRVTRLLAILATGVCAGRATTPAGAAYATFPLAFACPVDSDDAQLEITATGPGTLRIGVVSLMPSDNANGWRREVVDVLESLRSGVYRWPGGTKESLKLGDKLVPEYLGPADWTGTLFQKCLDDMDMISEHYYNYDSHFDLASAKQVPNAPNEALVDWMRRPANHIRLKYEEYQEYVSRIPALKRKPVPIALDEYAYTFGGSYKVVPAYAWNFHEMFRHSDLYQLATLTFITSTYSAARGQAVLNPTGMLFKLYRDRFGTVPVEVSGNSPQPRPTDPPGGEQPVVHAGSDTFPLDVAAAWTADRTALTVAVINPTEAPQTLSLDIRGAVLSGRGTLRRMAPQSLTANVVVGQEPGVRIDEQSLTALPTNPTLAPHSVNIYEFPAK